MSDRCTAKPCHTWQTDPTKDAIRVITRHGEAVVRDPAWFRSRRSPVGRGGSVNAVAVVLLVADDSYCNKPDNSPFERMPRIGDGRRGFQVDRGCAFVVGIVGGR